MNTVIASDLHDHHHHSTRNIRTAFFLNLVFTIIEIVGGFLTNSVSIMSDALHDFGDTVSLGLSWRLEKLAGKKRDSNFTYGYRRFSLVGAFINSAVLIVGSIFILVEVVPRLWSPVQPDTQGMVLLAILGIVFNGIAVVRLQHGHTMNEKAVRWHLIEDVLGWVVVLVISIIMHFVYLPILDPLFSLIFTGYILFNVFKSFNETIKIFLQAKPRNVDVASLENEITNVPGVLSIHDIHIWSLDGEYDVMTLHIVVGDNTSKERIKVIKDEVVKTSRVHKVQHVTVEVEHECETCEHVDC